MSKRTPKHLLAPRHWPSWLIAGLLRLLVLLPYPWLMATGRMLGRLIQRLAKRRERIARINLALCFPEQDEATRDQLLRDNFEAVGMAVMEIAMAWWWPCARLEKLLIRVEGAEHLPAASDPRGTIYLTAHMTSLELSGRFLSHRASAYAMYRRNENPVIQWLFERYRTGFMEGIIARDDIKPMLKVLKDGGGVWYAPDQNYGHKARVFADFMGVSAASNPATSRFAKVTGARVIPFTLFREQRGYRLVIEAPLEDFPSQDPQADTLRINDIYSRWVKQAPAQYNWIHRRFKARPDGEASVYQDTRDIAS